MIHIVTRRGEDCPVSVEVTETEFELVKIAATALPKSAAVARLWSLGKRSTPQVAAIVDAAIAANLTNI